MIHSMAGLLGPYAQQAAQKYPQKGLLDGADLYNPLLMAGLGLLAGNQKSTQPPNPYAGLMAGLEQSARMQQYGQQKKYRDLMLALQMKRLMQQENPSNVREWNFYNSLSKEDQERFLTMKRAMPGADLGGTYAQLSPSGSGIVQSFDKTLPPQDEPGTRGAQTAAEEAAKTAAAQGLERQKLIGRGEIPETEKKLTAQGRLSGNLAALSDYYDQLERKGAAIDVKKGSVDNLVNAIAASGPGQLVGRALGTEAQSIRNQINQMRPLLLQDIRKASEQGAKGLDSNTELEFYLQAATDPSRDIQANRAALEVLDKAYGLGANVKASEGEVEDLRREWNKAKQANDPLGILE